jgi:hypothetical protein
MTAHMDTTLTADTAPAAHSTPAEAGPVLQLTEAAVQQLKVCLLIYYI